MDFRFSEVHQRFRLEVRDFLDREVTERWKSLSPVMWEESDESWELARGFQRVLGRRHWLAPQYPVEYGGLGTDNWHTVILREEMAYARAPFGWDTEISVNWVGPTLLRYGTEEQRRRQALGIATGDLIFCLGYSEPEAGSDLAALRTRAARDGDTYVIEGQKLFTTLAHRADYCLLAARMDGQAAGHQGLSLFIVDMRSPGVLVRPLVNVMGSHSFNEVFFERVRVPRENLVGVEGRGWHQLMTALTFERAGTAWPGEIARTLDELVYHLQQGSSPDGQPQHHRARIAELVVANAVLRLLCYRAAWLHSRGEPADSAVSEAFVFGSELVRKVADAAMAVHGASGMVERGSRRSPDGGRTAQAYLSSLAAGIGGGTLEVQRNIIANRGLGLPRG